MKSIAKAILTSKTNGKACENHVKSTLSRNVERQWHRYSRCSSIRMLVMAIVSFHLCDTTMCLFAYLLRLPFIFFDLILMWCNFPPTAVVLLLFFEMVSVVWLLVSTFCLNSFNTSLFSYWKKLAKIILILKWVLTELNYTVSNR